MINPTLNFQQFDFEGPHADRQLVGIGEDGLNGENGARSRQRHISVFACGIQFDANGANRQVPRHHDILDTFAATQQPLLLQCAAREASSFLNVTFFLPLRRYKF